MNNDLKDLYFKTIRNVSLITFGCPRVGVGEFKEFFNQKDNQEKLGLDPTWKHVVNVGLFTPRKNQAYLFDIAKRLREYKIKFHFTNSFSSSFFF